jgi:UDP-2,3-diacylglucosamine pyrophosphatase LpxH
MEDASVFVISDLHLGAGALDDFEAAIEREFVRFLAFCRSSGKPVELVINGDLLDFVQAPPYKGADLESQTDAGLALCFTEDQSLKKLDAIERQHENAFDALAAFILAGPHTRITILPGNHDVDFFWGRIRKRFLDRVCGAEPELRSRVAFHLDRVYRPPIYPDLWIEHGHQYDQLNRFFVADTEYWSSGKQPIFPDGDGHPRLLECIGTRFLIRFLNDLDASYPYVDNVKPFSRFLQLFFLSAIRPGLGPLRAGLALLRMVHFLNQTVKTQGTQEVLDLRTGGEPPPDEAMFIRTAFGRASSAKRRAFAEGLAARGVPLDRDVGILLNHPMDSKTLLAVIESHPELLDALDPPESDETLDLVQGFSISETDSLKQAAREIASAASPRAIVMGHTHEIVEGDPDSYINTGCWIPYLKVEAGTSSHPWSRLRSRRGGLFPHRLMYVLARPSEGNVTLKQFA